MTFNRTDNALHNKRHDTNYDGMDATKSRGFYNTNQATRCHIDNPVSFDNIIDNIEKKYGVRFVIPKETINFPILKSNEEVNG